MLTLSDLRRLRRALARLGALGPLAAFVTLAPALGALVLVATAPQWLEPLQRWGVPAFLAATVVLAGLSLVPTHASSLVAGLLFGAAAGSLLALAGVLGAACLSYALLRGAAGGLALRGLARRPRAAAVHRALVQESGLRCAGLIALVRLSPIMPFAGTNLLMAAAGVGARAFFAGTLVGLAPRVVAVAVAGAGLAELDLSRGADARLAAVGAIATLAAVALVARIARGVLADVAPTP